MWAWDGQTKLHAKILRGNRVQKNNPNMFTVGRSSSAASVLPAVYVISSYTYTRTYTNSAASVLGFRSVQEPDHRLVIHICDHRVERPSPMCPAIFWGAKDQDHLKARPFARFPARNQQAFLADIGAVPRLGETPTKLMPGQSWQTVVEEVAPCLTSECWAIGERLILAR